MTFEKMPELAVEAGFEEIEKPGFQEIQKPGFQKIEKP